VKNFSYRISFIIICLKSDQKLNLKKGLFAFLLQINKRVLN